MEEERPRKKRRTECEVDLKKVIFRIAKDFDRSDDEAAALVRKLDQNWITSIEHWKRLDDRSKADFPVVVVQQLDRLVDNPLPSLLSPPSTYHSFLNSSYTKPGFINPTEYKNRQPFGHCSLPDFLNDPKFVQSLEEEIQSLPFYRKKNDLYDFFQTNDLKTSTLPHIAQFRKIIYSKDFRSFLTSVTGIPNLTSTIDLSAAIYKNGSTLLCHDDHIEGRRIAFIYYLTPKDWEIDVDGGALGLFNVDENKQPNELAACLSPARNSLAFFNVTETSWHTVCEILSKEGRDRMSISGWFHGDIADRDAPYDEPDLVYQDANASKQDLPHWINDTYLEDNVKLQIREHFLETSEVNLSGFLKTDMYSDLVCDLHDQKWIITGPKNKRHYEIIQSSATEEPPKNGVVDFKTFFTSKAFLQFISEITGFNCRKQHLQVRKFQNGAYTLVHDLRFEEEENEEESNEKAKMEEDEENEHELEEAFLDVILNCPSNDFEEDVGGYTVYLDSISELLTSVPQRNTLVIVKRDVKTMRFVKYLNNKCTDILYDFSLINTQ